MEPGYCIFLINNTEHIELVFPINSDEYNVVWIAQMKKQYSEVYVVKYWFEDWGIHPGWKSKVIYSNIK